MNADGTGEHPFVQGPPPGQPWYANYGHPAFTHDGASLIFDRTGALEMGLIDGGEHHVILTVGSGIGPFATVSPDGEDIAVASDCGIRVAPLRDAGTLCTTGASLDSRVAFVDSRPSWSVAGMLAYASSMYSVSVVAIAGGEPTQILDTKASLGGVYVGEVAWTVPGATLP